MALIGWFQMEIRDSDWLVPNQVDLEIYRVVQVCLEIYRVVQVDLEIYRVVQVDMKIYRMSVDMHPGLATNQNW